MEPRCYGGSGARDGDGDGERSGPTTRAREEEGMVGGGRGEAKSAVSGSSLERSGDGTQRKAVGSAGLTVGAGIATVHDEERSVSWSG